MSFIPLEDRILIDPIETEATTAGGIIIAQTDTNSAPITGTIVAVGPGRYQNGTLIPMSLLPGQMVTWSKFAGSHIIVDGIEMLIMRESDINGVIGDVK